jgi:hypothetical protein
VNLFHEIVDGMAIIRKPKGVRVCGKFGDTWGTSHPNITVLDIEGPNVVFNDSIPRLKQGWVVNK